MRRTCILILLNFPFLFLAFGQSVKIDSLFRELDRNPPDSDKVDILHAIGKDYFDRYHDDTAVLYLERAIDLAKENSFTSRLADAYYLRGRSLPFTGELEKGIHSMYQANKLYAEVGNEKGLFDVQLAIGVAYDRDGIPTKAVLHFDTAEMLMNPKDLRQKTEFNRRLGDFYWYQGNYQQAKKFFFNNLELAKQSGDSSRIYNALAYLGSLYSDLEKPDSAIYFIELALPAIEKLDPPWATCLKGCLGICYKQIGDCKNALIYLREGLEESKKMGRKSFDCISYAEMGVCLLDEGDPEEGLKYINLAKELLDDSKDLKQKRAAYWDIMTFYKKTRNYEEAFFYLEELDLIEDSLITAENERVTEELIFKYQTREQQNQLEVQSLQLKNQRALISGSIVLLLLLFVLIFLGIWLLRYRKHKNRLLAEKNQQLLELDQAKSRFFSNISHELRTPLTLVVAPLYQAVEKAKNSPVINDLQIAYSNSQKLSVLVDEILDLSKLESGQMRLHYSVIRLDEVIRRIFFAFESLANTQRIRLNYKSSLPSDLWIKSDFPKLEKILNNLVSNAVKYSKKGGEVNCSAGFVPSGDNTGQLTIKVTDTGVGISERDLPRIFDRFYQSDENPLMGGTGIGLALTKELVSLFGGRIEAESELGSGSIFTVEFPVETVDPGRGEKERLTIKEIEETESQVNEDDDQTGYVPILLNGEKPRILIVEDNPEMSRFLKQSLSKNYETKVAYNGTEGIKHLEREHFDLVTSDVMMPEMDGFEFLEKVRKKGTSFSNIPVVMLTARALEADKLEGFQLGVDDYVTKPFSVKELVARIDNLLKNQQARKKLENNEGKESVENTDRQRLKTAEKVVMNNISDPGFGVQELASALAISQRSLVRLINRLAGMTPVNFIREIRLQKAYQLLKRRQFLTVTEVRYEVGIEHASYFNKKFKERFGVSPKEVMGKGE